MMRTRGDGVEGGLLAFSSRLGFARALVQYRSFWRTLEFLFLFFIFTSIYRSSIPFFLPEAVPPLPPLGGILVVLDGQQQLILDGGGGVINHLPCIFGSLILSQPIIVKGFEGYLPKNTLVS